jgi:hypothetical protein
MLLTVRATGIADHKAIVPGEVFRGPRRAMPRKVDGRLRKPANVTKLLRVTNYNGSLCAEKQRHRGCNIAADVGHFASAIQRFRPRVLERPVQRQQQA